MNLENAISEYLESREQAGISPRTIRDERSLLNRYLAFCDEQGLKKRDRLLLGTAITYHYWLKTQSLSPERQKRHISALFRLVSFHFERQKTGKCPEKVEQLEQKWNRTKK